VRVIWRLAAAELWRRPAHTLILALAVALGAALVTAIQAVNGSTLAALRETFALLGGEAALQVRGRGGHLPETLVEQIAALPGVAHASGLVSETIWIGDGPARGETLTLFGIDLGDDRALRAHRIGGPGTSPIEDPLLFLAQPDSALLTDTLMSRAGITLEDEVRVLAPSGPAVLTARGRLPADGIGRLFAGGVAVMDLWAAQRLLSATGFVEQVDVVVDAEREVAAVQAALEAALPPGLEVVSPERRGAAVERMLRAFHAVLAGISVLGLMFGSFVSYNVASTAVGMRLRELGTLRCVGASRAHVRALVTAEVALPALTGSVAGIGLGALLARGLCQPLAHALAYGLRVALPVEGASVPLSAVPVALAAGVGAALLGAWGPAAAAARLAPRRIGAGVVAVPATRLAWIGAGALGLSGASLAAAVARDSGLLANVAILCLNAGIIMVGLAALPALGARTQRVLAACGAYGRVAGDALLRAPVRASVTVTVIAMALAATLTIGSVVASFKGSVLTFLRGLWAADLIVSSPYRSGAWLAAPLAEEVAAEVAAVPGVARIAVARYVDLEGGGERLTLRAIGREFLEEPRFGGWPFHAGRRDQALRAVAAGEGLLVSDGVARRHDLRVGQPYTLATPTGPLTLPIAGIIVDYLSESGTVTIARETYLQRWHDRLVNYVVLLAAPGVAAGDLRLAILRHFAGRMPLRVVTPREFSAAFERDLDGVFGFLWALRAAVIVLAALGIADTLLGLGVARARELGVLRALGARRRGVYGLFGLELLLPGGFAVGLGLAGAVALSAAWVRFLTYQLGWHLDLHLPLSEYAALAAATLILCPLAALLPIGWLARRRPAALLAHE
jgi:putative ABC transport system permease protein